MSKRKKRPGTWVRIHDQMHQDERVLDLAMRGDRGLAAVAVFVMSVGWTHAKRLDGFVPAGALSILHGKKGHADLLVSTGLWQTTKGGWMIPRYTVWNDTAQEIDQSEREAAQRGVKAACKRWHPQPCNRDDCPANEASNVVQLGGVGDA